MTDKSLPFEKGVVMSGAMKQISEAKVPLDVMRDIHVKSEKYRILSKRLREEAKEKSIRADQLEEIANDLKDMASAWKAMFPATTDSFS